MTDRFITDPTTGGQRTKTEIEPKAVKTDRIDPSRKVGVIGDIHWGQTGGAGFVDSLDTLKGKLDDFIEDMNSWDADVIIFLGDMMNPTGTSSQTEAEDRLEDAVTYLESGLNADIKYGWGNHESGKQNSYGLGWNLDNFGYSSFDETYFTVDYPEVKLITINNSYSEDDSVTTNYFDRGQVSGQYDWLKGELDKTNKPVVMFGHHPFSGAGTSSQYDRVDSEYDWKVPSLISQYDNVLAYIYGHDHYQAQINDKNVGEPSYNHSFAQDYLGTRYIYQHFPHRLGTTADSLGDSSVTPYGKLYARPDGYIEYEQSYAGNTQYRGTFEAVRGQASNSNHKYRYDRRTAEHSPRLDPSRWVNTSGGGTVQATTFGTDEGEAGGLKFTTDATSGSTLQYIYRNPLRPLYTQFLPQSPPAMAWSMTLEVPDDTLTNAEWELKYGGVDGGFPHMGYEYDGNTLKAVVDNESGTRTTVADGIGFLGTGPYNFYMRYDPETPRVDFITGYTTSRSMTSISAGLPFDLGGKILQSLMNVRITTNEDVSKVLHITDAEIAMAPTVDMLE